MSGQESNSLLLGDDPDEDFWIVLRTGLTNSEAIKTVDNMGDVMTDLGKVWFMDVNIWGGGRQ